MTSTKFLAVILGSFFVSSGLFADCNWEQFSGNPAELDGQWNIFYSDDNAVGHLENESNIEIQTTEQNEISLELQGSDWSIVADSAQAYCPEGRIVLVAKMEKDDCIHDFSISLVTNEELLKARPGQAAKSPQIQFLLTGQEGECTGSEHTSIDPGHSHGDK